ncbi:hypothetical protein [Mesorhizobium sp. M0085]|uniref:hypothetical protein n=1 Tax=Mesorhizobium sp. M0085 TaxID=2956872 RepID=UPI003336D0DC
MTSTINLYSHQLWQRFDGFFETTPPGSDLPGAILHARILMIDFPARGQGSISLAVSSRSHSGRPIEFAAFAKAADEL